MSGGGGGNQQPTQPTNQTITNNPIADWAQPTATSLIGSQMHNAFNIDDNGNILGSRGFTPFGGQTNAQGQFTGSPVSQDQYNQQLNVAKLGVAGPSALQQQSYQGAANLQTPGQFGQASQMAGYGAASALGAGQNFENKATDPGSVQAYMNPYLQNSLQPQLAEIQRQYGITGTQQAGQATQSGAFGGGRDAIMAAENDRNKNTAMNTAIGQGYNTAFNNAQSQMNTGAQLGLQGAQAGIQGAGQLGQLGTQQLAAQQGVLNTQNQMGTQEQQNQQNVINQALQNYGNQQNYSTTQAGNIMNLLRATPTSQTQTQYQAAPNAGTQMAGLAATGIGAYGALKAEGGIIREKRMAGGGIASGVPAEKLPSMLGKLSDQQLAQKADLETNDPETAASAISQQQFRSNTRQGFASGGIVAFASGGDAVDQMGKYEKPDQDTLNEFYNKNDRIAPNQELGKSSSGIPSMMDIATQQKDAGTAYLEAIKGAKPDKNQQMYSMLANFGARLAGGKSSNALTNLGTAAEGTAPEIGQLNKENRLAKLEEAKAGFDVSKMDSATLMEIAKNANQDKQKELDRLMHMGMSKQQAEATMYSADQHLKGVYATNKSNQSIAATKAVSNKNLFATLYTKNLAASQKTHAATGAKIPLTAEEMKKIQIDTLEQVNLHNRAYGQPPLNLSDIVDTSTSSNKGDVELPKGVVVKKIN